SECFPEHDIYFGKCTWQRRPCRRLAFARRFGPGWGVSSARANVSGDSISPCIGSPRSRDQELATGFRLLHQTGRSDVAGPGRTVDEHRKRVQSGAVAANDRVDLRGGQGLARHPSRRPYCHGDAGCGINHRDAIGLTWARLRPIRTESVPALSGSCFGDLTKTKSQTALIPGSRILLDNAPFGRAVDNGVRLGNDLRCALDIFMIQ